MLRPLLITALTTALTAALTLVASAASGNNAGNTAQGKIESAQRGEQIYARCLACHALAYDRVGPHHCGLIGRRAGSVAGFAYSAAMKKSGVTWNEASLNRFLTKPLKMVPGSSMTYDGIPDAKERTDLITYLKQAGQSAECKK